jgi:4,5-DOPA dioxygenase extradiol
LMLAFPQADIPVVQVSVDPARDASHHFAIGRALSPLRAENVLVIGSGHITHNLRGFFMRGRDAKFDAQIDRATADFVAWIERKVATADIDALLDWERQAPDAALNHPEVEHFLPFFVALGAGGSGDGAMPRQSIGIRIHHSLQSGFFAYDHYAFGKAA